MTPARKESKEVAGCRAPGARQYVHSARITNATIIRINCVSGMAIHSRLFAAFAALVVGLHADRLHIHRRSRRVLNCEVQRLRRGMMRGNGEAVAILYCELV